MFAAMVGGLTLSRAIRKVDKAGSDDILRAITDQLEKLIMESKRKSKKRNR